MSGFLKSYIGEGGWTASGDVDVTTFMSECLIRSLVCGVDDDTLCLWSR